MTRVLQLNRPFPCPDDRPAAEPGEVFVEECSSETVSSLQAVPLKTHVYSGALAVVASRNPGPLG